MDISKYELKTRPILPRKICNGDIEYSLGIVSPSLFHYHVSDEEVQKYLMDNKRYQLHKRTLCRGGYKGLVRAIKREKVG